VDGEDGLWSFRVYGEADADVVLVLLPALGVPARYYAPLVRSWLDENVAVVQADFLASRLRPDAAQAGRDGFAALVERCVPAIFGTVRDSLPRAAPVIVGHSLGGQLGLIAAARFSLLAKTPAAWVTRRNYAASLGTAKPGAHFTWVKDQPGLAGIIAQWARSR
jgi:predicted alpha/beta hydrolase